MTRAMVRLMRCGNITKRGIASRRLSSSTFVRFSKDSKNMTHTASLNMPLGEPKTLADVWTRSQKKNIIHCHMEREATVRKQLLALNAQGSIAPMTEREDYFEAIKAIKDMRQKDEQESNHPIYRAIRLAKDHFREWTWSTCSESSSSSSARTGSQSWWTSSQL